MFKQRVIFTKDECEQIIKYSEDINDIYNSDIERRFGVNYISYNVYNVDKYNWIFTKLLNFFIEETDSKIKENPKIVHMHKYDTGGGFIKHHDKNQPTRVFNIGVQLNDDYEGGELNLYYDNKITVDKIAGNCYIFRPEIFHEVLKVREGARWSLILFLHYDNLVNDLTKKNLL